MRYNKELVPFDFPLILIIFDQKKLKKQEVNSSRYTNTLTFSTSSTSITIYVSRAFKRVASQHQIRQPVAKAELFAPPGATFLRTAPPTIVNFLAVPGFYRSVKK